MDESPRSSKRRKLDTPARTPASPLVKSTLRKSSARLAARSTPLVNGDDASNAHDAAATPTRRSTRKLAGTPSGVVNGAVDGTPKMTPSRPAHDATVDPRSADRAPFRSLVNESRLGAQPDQQDELAVVTLTPSNRVASARPLGYNPDSPGHQKLQRLREIIDMKLRRVADADDETLDPLHTDGVNGATPLKMPSGRKPPGSSVARKQGSKDADELGEPVVATPSRSSKRLAPNATPTRSSKRLAPIAISDSDELEIPVIPTPTRSSKRLAPAAIANSEDSLGDLHPPSLRKSVIGRRRANRADHISHEDDDREILGYSADEPEGEHAVDFNQEDSEDAGVDGHSALGSVLDPTEPSPFNQPSPAAKTTDAVPLLQGNIPSGRGLNLLKAIVMERIMAKRPVPLVSLDDEYKSVHQLVAQTISAGEGNSMLLIGARGSGKTALVNKVLSEISKDNSEDYHVVRLNGFIHTDDKIALREIWRQLGKEMDIEEDGGGLGKNYADTLSTLLALLSHPSEHTGELTDQVAKAVIFVMDEFDLFALHPRQTLLYNLFDIAQSRKAPIAVLGLTTRIDVANSLEKRVKSRFSHRYIHLSLAKTFTAFQDMCKASLLIQPDQLSVEERSILCSAPRTATPSKSKRAKTPVIPDTLATWNANVSSLFASKAFLTSILAPHFYLTKSIQIALTPFLYSTATLSADCPLSITSTLNPPDSKLSLLPSLSTLCLSLLIAAARLDIIHDSDTCNFNMAYDEYVTLASKARIQSAAGGSSASGSVSKVWGKEVARREWEGLIELGLVVPVIGGQVGTFGMVKCDVALEEIGAVVQADKGIERALDRWCRQL